MKTVWCMGVVFLLGLSCRFLSADQVKAFIPGVYVRHYIDDYTDSYDTIVIKAVNDHYEVIKRTSFEKLQDNGRTEPGYRLQKWTGHYDEKTQSLWLDEAGKAIAFDPAKKELTIGIQPYKKL